MLEHAVEMSREMGLTKIGTEALLLSMYRVEGSICRFLLSEYDVEESDIKNILRSFIILRKQDDIFTDKFLQVMKMADALAIENEHKEISDEHLFFSLLAVKNTIFSEIVDRLGLNNQVLLDDLREIFEIVEEEDEIKNYTVNITQKAKNKELSPFIGREDYIERMLVVLNRKNKNNPLLVGSAGVGKTAIVEGLAQYYVKHRIDVEVISLNMASILANTKYRGDFEGRIDKLTKALMKKKNAILFIDEIHTIMGAGSSEGTLDAANILKPFLARNNFKCIGATTIEEYRKTIMNDKALNRRFQSIFVNEPNEEETKEILFGLRKDFEKFHKVSVANHIIKYIVSTAKQKLSNRKFPDKAIDILDEAMSLSSMKRKEYLSVLDIDIAVNQISGLKPVVVKDQYLYEEIRPYYLDNFLGVCPKKTLLTVNFIGNEQQLKTFKEEVKDGFGITDEMVLELDMANYTEPFSISSLIGSPPGYVGHQEGGLLSEHIGKFPFAMVVVEHFFQGAEEIQSLVLNILKKGFFYDKKNQLILCQNLILIFQEQKKTNQSIGFFSQEKKQESDIFYYIDLEVHGKEGVMIEQDCYQEIFSSRGYQLEYDKTQFIKHKEKFQTAFVDLLQHYQKGNYRMELDQENHKVSIIEN